MIPRLGAISRLFWALVVTAALVAVAILAYRHRELCAMARGEYAEAVRMLAREDLTEEQRADWEERRERAQAQLQGACRREPAPPLRPWAAP